MRESNRSNYVDDINQENVHKNDVKCEERYFTEVKTFLGVWIGVIKKNYILLHFTHHHISFFFFFSHFLLKKYFL